MIDLKLQIQKNHSNFGSIEAAITETLREIERKYYIETCILLSYTTKFSNSNEAVLQNYIKERKLELNIESDINIKTSKVIKKLWAARDYRKITKIFVKDRPKLNLNDAQICAICLEKHGMLDEALELLKSKEKLYPLHVGLKLNISKIYQKKQNIAMAKLVTNNAMLINEYSKDLISFAAYIDYECGNYTECLDKISFIKDKGDLGLELLLVRINCLIEQNEMESAEKELNGIDEKLKTEPRYIAVRSRLFMHNMEPISCINYLKEKLENPKLKYFIYETLGNAYLAIGDKERARTNFENALNYGRKEVSFLHLSKITKDPSMLSEIDATLEQTSPADHKKRALLYFAKFSILDTQLKYEEAADCLRKANQNKLNEPNYSASQPANFEFDYLSANIKCHLKAVEDDLPTPIFVVGMPRSGTSLMEKFICNNIQALACGEKNILAQMVAKLKAADLDQDGLNNLRNEYFRKILYKKDNCEYVVDKTPSNFRFIPFINAVFPNCKIIIMDREKNANLWSLYNTHFAGTTQNYSYSINALTKYFSQFVKIKDRLKNDKFENVMEYKYEWLVDNANSLSDLSDFLGFEVLKNNSTTSITPSYTNSNYLINDGIKTDRNNIWIKYRSYFPDLFN